MLLALSVEERARRHGLHGKGVTLKLTYADMRSITRSKAVISADSAGTIYTEAVRMLGQVEELQERYGLDFAGHLEDIYHGNVLHRTIEYMRKHYPK